MEQAEQRVSLFAIFRVFFGIGAFSFGGGLIGWVHREVVTRRGWLTEDQFLPGVALGQVLPGANVANVAVYVGQVLRGPIGSIVAVTSVLAAPFFLCIALAAIYSTVVGIPGFHAATAGIAAAATGMILRMGYVGALYGCRRPVQKVMAGAVFAAIGILQWPLVPVVLIAAPLSVALVWPRKPRDV